MYIRVYLLFSTRQPWPIARAIHGHSRDFYIYIDLPPTVQPTTDNPGPCCTTLQGLKCIFEKQVFFPMMTPIDIRPIPCVTQFRHRSACKISSPYIAPFWRRSQTHDYDDCLRHELNKYRHECLHKIPTQYS